MNAMLYRSSTFQDAAALLFQRGVRAGPTSDLGFGEAVSQILQFIALLVAFFLFWYFLQRIMAFLFMRRAASFCPKCFGAHIEPASIQYPIRLLPFLPQFACSECDKTFFRGRKPSFARCPACRSSRLKAASRASGRLRNIGAAITGANGYQCLRCNAEFFDSRPIRSKESVQDATSELKAPTRKGP